MYLYTLAVLEYVTKASSQIPDLADLLGALEWPRVLSNCRYITIHCEIGRLLRTACPV